MLVSHRHRFIYLKTRKTAGTSVEVFLEPWCHGPEPYPGPAHYRPPIVTQDGIIGGRWTPGPGETNPWPAHMHAADLRAALGAATWNSYRKFCVVRNPYDQAVSAFWFTAIRSRTGLTAETPFAEVRARFHAWLAARRPILDNRRIFLIGGRFALDEVLRFERLEDDLRGLVTRLGLPEGDAALGRYKAEYRQRPEPWPAYYDARSARRVEVAKAVEFELFGYERLSA